MVSVKASSPEVSHRMAKVRQQGTDVEIALRKALHQQGLRYRVGFTVLKKPRRTADVAFPKLKIAIFVDGCFWHGCPLHATWPKKNATFWKQKIEANRTRDMDTNTRLEALGWKVVRIWAHEPVITAASFITRIVEERRSPGRLINGQSK